jgi:hypothetical protein
MIINATDPSFRNLATVSILWTPKIRRCTYAKTIHTLPEMSDALSWAAINGAVAEFVHKSVGICERFAAEEMAGVRHGKDDRGQSGANSDPLLQIQGGIRMACAIYCVDLWLVRSQSVNAALGIVPPRRGTMTDYMRKKWQKAATRTVVNRLLSATESLDEHQIDACGIAIACALGKGKQA